MAIDFSSKPTLMDHQLKSQRLVFEVAITANATPASKEHNVDIPGVAYLRTEGKVAESDAVEDLSASFTAAVDNSTGDSQFGVLIAVGDAKKVKKVTVTEQTALASSLSVTSPVTDYLTSGKNIAIDIAGTGLNLASESPTLLIEVEYDQES